MPTSTLAYRACDRQVRAGHHRTAQALQVLLQRPQCSLRWNRAERNAQTDGWWNRRSWRPGRTSLPVPPASHARSCPIVPITQSNCVGASTGGSLRCAAPGPCTVRPSPSSAAASQVAEPDHRDIAVPGQRLRQLYFHVIEIQRLLRTPRLSAVIRAGRFGGIRDGRGGSCPAASSKRPTACLPPWPFPPVPQRCLFNRSSYAESNITKRAWCLVVITTCFCPAALAGRRGLWRRISGG